MSTRSSEEICEIINTIFNGIINVVNAIDTPSKKTLHNIPENPEDPEELIRQYQYDEITKPMDGDTYGTFDRHRKKATYYKNN